MVSRLWPTMDCRVQGYWIRETEVIFLSSSKLVSQQFHQAFRPSLSFVALGIRVGISSD